MQSDYLGWFDVTLPLGSWTFVFSRGFEYLRHSVEVNLPDRLRRDLGAVLLERHVDLSTQGWHPGDLHQHSSYSDGYQDVATVLLSAVANGLSWGALTDHNSVAGTAEWLQATRAFGNEPLRFVPLPGCEVTTDRGHFNLIGSEAPITPGAGTSPDDTRRILSEAQATGGLLQLNHPHLESPMGFLDWEFLEQFDLLEVWNGKGEPNASSNAETKKTWYEMLSKGHFIPASAGSDNHDVTGGYLWARDGDQWMNRGLFSGTPRVYIQSTAVTKDDVLHALRGGHSFLSNGPLPRLSVSGVGPGARLDAGTHSVLIEATDVRGLERLDLIVNGKVVHEQKFSGELDGELSFMLTGHPGDWCLVEAFGAEGGYALSNPVFFGPQP